jgi:hypothetical protein
MLMLVTGGSSLSIYQSPLLCPVPVRTVAPSLLTITLLESKVATHPLSHSCPIETSECVARSRKMCVLVASGGKIVVVISRSASCIDLMVVPFGM